MIMKLSINNILAFLFPLLVALLLTGFIPQGARLDERLQLERLKVSSASELEAAFDRLGYHWPPQGKVPPVEVSTLPADLGKIQDVDRKKSLFFRALLPIVLAENEKLRELRGQVVELLDTGVRHLDDSQRAWLQAIAHQYKIKHDIKSARAQHLLLRRVDVVPPALVLAQAANESAWGTSRFSRLGNNLFGQWTYREAEGIVPLGRPEGASYAVRSFPSIDASVRAYLRNLNTNPAYQSLRVMRAQMRDAGGALDAVALATGLEAYSARGQAYIDELQLMMRGNRLVSLLDAVELDRSTAAFSQSRQGESTAG
ncbi:hypothetical protein Tel_04250 [Candidatus Tenderia electrophaga]|jgi:Bax protein|uniref:Mannosyl-glycoprotein endo-beta-N-acetylglucosamidase-like domain-containing protein n=1 Tax=Candidatus Tenderia electrophaga TaxID=1748243 RepID=A0A0S2TB80_9GAMM|nr:hypothetical protein Tel_04250 [Candidatus Tenderia electrophaga]